MGQNRIAVICSPLLPEWRSCQVIAANLAKSYQEALGSDARFFDSRWTKPSDSIQTAELIYRFQPERIVFADHTPHPGILLSQLRMRYGTREVPPVDIHVYGDFTLQTREWLSVEPLLKGLRIRWFCASFAQKNLLSRLIRHPQESVVYVPFPVNSEIYVHDPLDRKRWRRKLELDEDEILIGYSGRVSLQKNTLRLVEEVLKFGRDRKVRLVLAGTFDDIGSRFFGIKEINGTMLSRWMRYLSQLLPMDRRKIRHLGALEPRALRGFYNALDIHCSFSIHHDEDFGMSAAEALCCGTPGVLTGWGGYCSFRGGTPETQGLDCELVPVRFGERGLAFTSSEAQRALVRASEATRTSERARQVRSREYHRTFSIPGIACRLRELGLQRASVFEGFTRLMHRHSEGLSTPPLFRNVAQKDGLYGKLYGGYLAANFGLRGTKNQRNRPAAPRPTRASEGRHRV